MSDQETDNGRPPRRRCGRWTKVSVLTHSSLLRLSLVRRKRDSPHCCASSTSRYKIFSQYATLCHPWQAWLQSCGRTFVNTSKLSPMATPSSSTTRRTRPRLGRLGTRVRHESPEHYTHRAMDGRRQKWTLQPRKRVKECYRSPALDRDFDLPEPDIRSPPELLQTIATSRTHRTGPHMRHWDRLSLAEL
jgi:hypothetical protein